METKPHLGDKEFVGPVKNTGAAAPEKAAVAGLGAGVRAAGSFKYKLSLNGVPIGWLGKGGSQGMWAEVVKNESDAVSLEWYYSGGDYLRIAGTAYNWMMTWSGGLSGYPVAFNDWPHANVWKESGGSLIAADSGAPVSLYSSDVAWLYANKDYKALEFTKVLAAGA